MKTKLEKVGSFAVYYGIGKLEELQKYQMVIVEPGGYSEEEISSLQKMGTIVIAYVSVMEILENGAYYKLLSKDDLLSIDGQIAVNKEFNTVLVDLQSKRWKAFLIQHIDHLLTSSHYDGVFLDTIADAELEFIPSAQQELQLNEAFKLLRDIRRSFEDVIIIQNNGLGRLVAYTAHFIDGICWENPPCEKVKNRKWLKSASDAFKMLRSNNIKILLLFEGQSDNSNAEKVEELAKQNDALIYHGGYRYLDI